MRVIFFGSGKFAVAALAALVEASHEVVLVCTRPPRRAGRGKPLRRTQIAEFAASRQLELVQPEDPDDTAILRRIDDAAPDVGVLADYARLLPESVLSKPRLGFLNIHPSLLPRWRGAAPIQRAVMAGDKTTGVCIMQMTAKLDRGPVLSRCEVPIAETDTSGSLARLLAAEGAKLIVERLASVDYTEPLTIDQSTSCYAKKITAAETQIDWKLPAEQIDWIIRGLSPSPGAWSVLGGKKIKLLDSRCENGTGTPGELLDGKLLVACGEGAVEIRKLQRSGKTPMAAEEFLRGFRVNRGSMFET